MEGKMKEFEVFFHGIGYDNVKLIRVQEDFTGIEVVKLAKEAGIIDTTEEEFEVFLEEKDEPLDKTRSLLLLEIKERAHFTFHHCKKIEVIVSYNGTDKADYFSPPTKIEKILKWALKVFEICGADATNKVLRTENGKELANNIRLGSLVNRPHCYIKLFLTAKVLVEG
jgi:hypothetical protein